MVNNQDALSTTFSALSDPTRRAILARLALGESTVTELAAPFRISLPAISKHLKVLEGAGLLARERDGRVHRCRLEPGPMKDAAQWIEHYRRFWESQLDSLERYLKDQMEREDTTWQPRAPRRHRSRSSAPSRPRGRRSSKHGRKKKR
jgi:DNA-binding transcriptional ArsR family regulator